MIIQVTNNQFIPFAYHIIDHTDMNWRGHSLYHQEIRTWNIGITPVLPSYAPYINMIFEKYIVTIFLPSACDFLSLGKKRSLLR